MPPKDPSLNWNKIQTLTGEEARKQGFERTGSKRPKFTKGVGFRDTSKVGGSIWGGKESLRYHSPYEASPLAPETQGMSRGQYAQSTAGKNVGKAAKDAAIVAEDAKLGWFGRTMKTVGPKLGTAMNLWFAWDMMRHAGYMGGEQSRGRDFMSAMGALQPGWQQTVETAGRMQEMRNQVGGMEDLARFAKNKEFATEGLALSMNEELDQLIGNKTAILSQASLLPPTTQALLSGAVQTGAL